MISLDSLNSVQKEIVLHTQGAVMVLAGAGSGKTRVLTQRIAYILDSGCCNPYNILAITFTNKAANEMKERISKINPDYSQVWAFTFHSLCAKILRSNISHLEGYTSSFSIYDDTDKKSVVKKIIKENGFKEDLMQDVIKHIGKYKNSNLSLYDYGKTCVFDSDFEDIQRIIELYEQKMKESNALDFDDLLLKTLELLKTCEEVRTKIQRQFMFILVDEFQDTNEVQYELVKILAGGFGNIFAVGDEDQSIYSWRGANLNNIKRFLNDFQNTKLYKLEQNYRSTKEIINSANMVIKKNVNRIDKTLWTDNAQGLKPSYKNFMNERKEAEFVVQEIYNLVHNAGYRYSDCAILMRLNALSRSFEDKLRDYDMPYKIYGGLKFYDRAEIKNVIAYLKILVNPKDDESFLRIVNFPKRNIGDASIASLNAVRNGSLLETLLSVDLSMNKMLIKFKPFKDLYLVLTSKLNEMGLTEFVEFVIDESGIINSYDTSNDEDKNRVENIKGFIDSVQNYENDNPDASIYEYLQSVSLMSDIDTMEESENAVIVSTVHAVKGLEFKVVFIVGLEETYFPIIRCDSSDESMEEERRLMYVAVTRAEERLYLTNCSSRYLYNRSNINLPSRFLRELGLIADKVSSPFENRRFEDRRTYNFDYSSSHETKMPQRTTSLNHISSSKSIMQMGTSTQKSYRVGDRVSHNKFGLGTIIEVNRGTDSIMIKFDNYGNKILSYNFAPIQKVG